MLALVIVRSGGSGSTVPIGADEATAECGGLVMVATDDPGLGADDLAPLHGVATRIDVLALGDFDVRAWAAALARTIPSTDVVVVPASADGRDLGPRLAWERRCPFHANALHVREDGAALVIGDGRALRDVDIHGAAVVTMSLGARSVERARPRPDVRSIPPASTQVTPGDGRVTTVEVLAADAATVDLAEAPRIVAGGAGLDGPARFEQLGRIGARLGASVGTTRVVTDRGWLPHQRQIGTTGVVVDPDLYLAFGISGAVQHTAGIGTPERIISVNTDPHCPMMQLADVAIVADANAVLDHLDELLRPTEDVA